MNQIICWLINQISYCLRKITHWLRMKQINKGIPWQFYEQYSIPEILKMKLNGTEEDKLEIYMRTFSP